MLANYSIIHREKFCYLLEATKYVNASWTCSFFAALQLNLYLSRRERWAQDFQPPNNRRVRGCTKSSYIRRWVSASLPWKKSLPTDSPPWLSKCCFKDYEKMFGQLSGRLYLLNYQILLCHLVISTQNDAVTLEEPDKNTVKSSFTPSQKRFDLTQVTYNS